MTHPLRVVLAGCGGISRAWLERSATSPISAWSASWTSTKPPPPRAEQFGWTEAAIGTDLSAMLDSHTPRCGLRLHRPGGAHPVTLRRCATAATCWARSRWPTRWRTRGEMVAAAQAAGKTYAVIQNRRYDPNIRRLRAFLELGAIGEITTVNCDFYIGAHFGGFRDRMEHVLLLDMAIHTFDAARLISGADATAVYCHEWNPAGSWYDHDASAVAIFEMTEGDRLHLPRQLVRRGAEHDVGVRLAHRRHEGQRAAGTARPASRRRSWPRRAASCRRCRTRAASLRRPRQGRRPWRRHPGFRALHPDRRHARDGLHRQHQEPGDGLRRDRERGGGAARGDRSGVNRSRITRIDTDKRRQKTAPSPCHPRHQ